MRTVGLLASLSPQYNQTDPSVLEGHLFIPKRGRMLLLFAKGGCGA